MDPVFGLPAMKDTKAMDAARARNKSHERHLVRQVETLDQELKSKNCKLHNTVSDLQQFLVDIDPNSNKPIIYPSGLSEQQKKEYRHIRKGSAPSMSLKEFDVRLETKRQQKRAQMPKRYKPEVEKQEVEKIVEVDVHSFCASIQKHRQTMREAYARATSSDVRFSESRLEVMSRNSDGKPQRRGSSSSGGSIPYPVGFNPEHRRNTVTGSVSSEKRDNSDTALDPRLVEILRSKVEAAALADSSDDD